MDYDSFRSYLLLQKERIGQIIDSRLAAYREADMQTLSMMKQEKYASLLQAHWDVVCDYPRRRGKYLRPALVMLMADAMGDCADKALLTAAAMQISEDWILIHDDWEDGSEERRGKPALHRLVGDAIAVNAGDALHECMHRVLAESFRSLPTDVAQRVQQEFFLMISRTCFGQYAEIKWTQDNRQDMTDEDVLFTISGKTVYYTIAGPLRLGALIAGATDEQLKAIYDFSYPLGLCFQIRDDVLDLTGDFDGQKKQKLNDIYEGKRTVILQHLLNRCSVEERSTVQSILDKSREEKSKQEVEYIRALMDTYGSIEYAEGIASDCADEALRRLSALDFLQAEYCQLFREAVEFILRRNH